MSKTGWIILGALGVGFIVYKATKISQSINNLTYRFINVSNFKFSLNASTFFQPVLEFTLKMKLTNPVNQVLPFNSVNGALITGSKTLAEINYTAPQSLQPGDNYLEIPVQMYLQNAPEFLQALQTQGFTMQTRFKGSIKAAGLIFPVDETLGLPIPKVSGLQQRKQQLNVLG